MSREKTACFSGHRPERFPDYKPHEFDALLKLLSLRINEAIDEGYTHFICGMAPGWDTIAGEAVLTVRRDRNLRIALELAIPFKGHMDRLKLDNEGKARYNRLLRFADKTTILCPSFHKAAFTDRDIYMVDNSSYLIYYWDGGPGGTSRAVKYAGEQGLRMNNLY